MSLIPLLLAVVAVEGPTDRSADPPAQTAQTFEGTAEVRLNYLLTLPTGYEDSDERYPLVLFLHGYGESGNDLEVVKKHGPPRRVAEGEQFPFILVSPQCPTGRWWQPTELLALLDHV